MRKFLGLLSSLVVLFPLLSKSIKVGYVSQIKPRHSQMSLFALSLGLILSLYFQSSAASYSNETDRLALLDFKSRITNDPLGVMASWNNSIHFCQWSGVTCGHRHRRVTFLNLRSHSLAGSISPHIGNLSFLKNISLQNNAFTGQIPPQLGRLHRLEVLRLENNSLANEIPANLSSCLNLIAIDLSYNHLARRVPVEIGFLMNLQILSLYNNNLTGNVPSSFGNLSSLQILYINSNRLGGRIPYILGQLKNLKRFGLSDNNFEGTIPLSIFNLSSMEVFDVHQNRLHGSLPLELGNLFPNLQYFSIFENRFRGTIPPSFSNASSIQHMVLSSNELSGQVPNLDDLQNLETLGLDTNSLGSGSEGDLRFLSTLTNATRLRRLSIGVNNFGGVLPHSLANLSSTTLVHFQIGYNQIGGRIPAGIANIKSLEAITAGNNRLFGSIPEDIGKLQRLHVLELDHNEFTGNIPSSFGNLGNLTSLLLDGNKLQGSIPSSLGNCQSLWQFSIADNSISGTIPLTLFTISSLSLGIDLSRNKLTGALPIEIGKLKNLGQLDVSENMLFGVIPSSLGSCVMLELLNMDENFFHGTVPSSFTSLRGLKYLNLSYNNLSGSIPNFLESFKFENLDLSFNNFSGSLPSGGIFKNASAVSVEGNNMLCGTTSDLHLPLCLSGERKAAKLKIIIIISVVLSSLVAAVVLISLICWWSKKKTKRDIPSSFKSLLLQLSYQILFTATDGFSSMNLIGVGGFGSVYKGVLDPLGIVAVKVFNLQRKGASKSFMVECEVLRNIRHRNLVKVLTVCSSIDSCGDDFKAIVYEFMANGNLDQWLHPATGLDGTHESTRKLNLLQRLNIAIDIASALDYLHCQFGLTPIVHCDLKPTNILLNDEMTALVADYGLMKFLSECTDNFSSASQTSTMGVRGTIGYAAPEYGMGTGVSTSGDMYSYGILLLEMFTAKKPTDDMFNDCINLHDYVKMALPDQVAEIADPILLEDSVGSSERDHKVEESLILIFGIGIACSEETPRKRISISDALAELIQIRDKEQQIIPRKRVG